jgi:hypothetical protein
MTYWAARRWISVEGGGWRLPEALPGDSPDHHLGYRSYWSKWEREPVPEDGANVQEDELEDRTVLQEFHVQ